jgi:hypothetical protein
VEFAVERFRQTHPIRVMSAGLFIRWSKKGGPIAGRARSKLPPTRARPLVDWSTRIWARHFIPAEKEPEDVHSSSLTAQGNIGSTSPTAPIRAMPTSRQTGLETTERIQRAIKDIAGSELANEVPIHATCGDRTMVADFKDSECFEHSSTEQITTSY